MIGERLPDRRRAGRPPDPDRRAALIEPRPTRRRGKVDPHAKIDPGPRPAASWAVAGRLGPAAGAGRGRGPGDGRAEGRPPARRPVAARSSGSQSVLGIVGDPGAGLRPLERPPGDLAAGGVLGPGPAVGLRPAGPAGPGRGGASWSRRATWSRRCSTAPSRGRRSSSATKLVDPDGPAGFVFAFRVLPTVIFVAALFAVLYHLGVMQWVVRGFAVVMARLMGASGAESLNVAASLFLGQTEAPLTIRPYLPRLTRSELLTVMTSGMAHVSGGVMAAYFAFGVEPRHILTAVIMTAPGTILLSKMLIPETEKPETLGHVRARRASGPTPTCSTPPRGAPARACNWP